MAGGIEEGEDDDVISTINIIPFVDIVLVLLIIFMLTSTAIIKASLKVELPRAASGGSAVDTTLNLVYTIDDELFLNGDPTDRDAVARFIQREIQTTPELQAVIAADKGVAYGKVVDLIDLVKQNGVKAFALNIERKINPEPKPDPGGG